MATLLIPPPGYIDPHDWTPLIGGLVQGTVTPTGDTTGASDTTAINTALSQFGYAQLINGVYSIQPGRITVGPQQAIRGYGGGTVLNVIGGTAGQAGLTFRNLNFPTSGDAFTEANTAGLSGGLVIVGTSATAGVHGVEIGDIYQTTILSLLIREFTGAGSVGLRFNNTIGWTERTFIQANVSHAAQCVTWEHHDAGGGLSTTSFAYSTFILTVRCNANQNGYSWRNGSNVYGGLLQLGGNFNSAATNTSVAMDLGTDASGPVVQAESGGIVVEANGGGAVQATDFNVGPGAQMRLTGNLIFRGNTWVAGSLVPATNNQVLVTGFCQTQGLGKGTSRMRKVGNAAVAVGQTANTPGAATSITPDGSQYQSLLPAAFFWTTAGIGAETIQINVTGTFNDGSTNVQVDTTTTNQTKSWNASQLGGMFKPDLALVSLSITCQSTIGNSTATVTVSFAGQNWT